jgi:hypothetical protein
MRCVGISVRRRPNRAPSSIADAPMGRGRKHRCESSHEQPSDHARSTTSRPILRSFSLRAFTPEDQRRRCPRRRLPGADQFGCLAPCGSCRKDWAAWKRRYCGLRRQRVEPLPDSTATSTTGRARRDPPLKDRSLLSRSAEFPADDGGLLRVPGGWFQLFEFRCGLRPVDRGVAEDERVFETAVTFELLDGFDELQVMHPLRHPGAELRSTHPSAFEGLVNHGVEPGLMRRHLFLR